MIHHAHIPDSIEETYQHREWFPVLRSLGIPDANIWKTAYAIERLGIHPTELRQALAAYLTDGTVIHADGNNRKEITDVFGSIRTQFIGSLRACDREPAAANQCLPLHA